MRQRLTLFATTALAASILAGGVHAQTKPAAANTIEELVITAEKREQSLQDVPVAVTAFTSEKRDLIGINTVADITNFTPGLQYSSQLDRISLRGVGRLTNVHGADGAVAIYSDGIYTSSTVEAGKTPLFVDRTEVLRGPQGTLYGRNSIGGAINVLSKRPTKEPYAEARFNYGNYNHYVAEAAISGPTGIEGVTYRLAANNEKQTKGWIDNIVPGMPDEGNIINTYMIEGQLKFDFNDKFDGWMKLSTINWDNGAGGPGSRMTWTKSSTYPTYEQGNGAIVLNPGYGCYGIATNVVNASPMGCVNPAGTDARKIASTVPYKVALRDTYIFASEWNYHFDTMNLKYVAGGTRYHYYLDGPTPVDNTAPITSYTVPNGLVINPRYAFNYQEDERWFSNELNLSSTTDSPLQWLVGAYYYHEAYEQPVYTTMADQTQLTKALGLPGTFCAQTGGVCAPNPLSRVYDNNPHLDIVSQAAFGQIDWQFTETWKLTVGLRYSSDHKYGYEQVRLLCFGVASCYAKPELNPFLGPTGLPAVDLTQLPSVVSAPAAGTKLPDGVSSYTTYDPATGMAMRHYNDTWAATTGTAGVQWEPDRDTMAYARYSRGYKAGGYRLGIDTVLGSSPETKEEYADSFEVGLKKNFGATLQTNLALFHYGYSNAQVPLTVAQTSGGLGQANSIFYNVPKAISQGVELETIWQPVRNLQLLFNYSYLDAHITDSSGTIDPADPAALDPQAKPLYATSYCKTTPSPCAVDIYTADKTNGGYQRGQDLKGQSLPNAPKNKVAFNANYTVETDTMGRFTGSISYSWRDVQYGSIFNRSYSRSPSWDQIDARFIWKPEGNKVTVIVYGKNLADKIGYEGGASGTRRNGSIYQNPALGQPQLNVVQDTVSTYPLTAPRTFGIELQYKFF